MKDFWDRFWSKVDFIAPNGCWEWKANLGRGYGMFWFSKTPIVAHRLSWTMLRYPIPEDKLVLHKCDNRKCVNPSHLFIGTQSDNVRDMYEKGRQGDCRTGITKYFSPTESKDIISMIDRGISLRNIAIKYGTTHGTLSRAIKDGRISI